MDFFLKTARAWRNNVVASFILFVDCFSTGAYWCLMNGFLVVRYRCHMRSWFFSEHDNKRNPIIQHILYFISAQSELMIHALIFMSFHCHFGYDDDGDNFIIKSLGPNNVFMAKNAFFFTTKATFIHFSCLNRYKN